MTAFLAQRPRRAFERLYRRHVGDVYRYALALLGHPADAADVTCTTFANAYVAVGRGEVPSTGRAWLTGLAHELCRQRAHAAPPPADPAGDEELRGLLHDVIPTGDDLLRAIGQFALDRRAAPGAGSIELAPGAVETLTFRARSAAPEDPEAPLSCRQAERALSRQLDGVLTAAEVPVLHAHVRGCAACAAFDRRQRAQSSALRALAQVPVPVALAPLRGRRAAGAGL